MRTSRHTFHLLLSALLLSAGSLLANHHLVNLAIAIQPDDIVTNTLGTGDEANYYYLVDIPESGVLRVYTQSTLDTYGELLLTDETEIAVADDGAEEGNFLIEAMVDPGEYLIRVAGATPFVEGPFNLVTEFTGDSEPGRPNGPVPVSQKIRTLTGASTDAEISAGAYRDGATDYSNSFATGGSITILAEIRPDSADVGKDGSIIVVLLSITSNGLEWSFLNEDGNFETWDLSLSSLGTAETRTPLEATNLITIFEGTLQAGRHRMAVGYQAQGGNLVYTAKAINIVVSD